MFAVSEKFRPLVQACPLRLEQDEVFFQVAESANSSCRVKRIYSFEINRVLKFFDHAIVFLVQFETEPP